MVALSLWLVQPVTQAQAFARKARTAQPNPHSHAGATGRAALPAAAAASMQPALPAPAYLENAFANARRAFQSADRAGLEQAARHAGDHPLAEYLPYWRMTLALRANAGGAELDEEVARFVADQPNRLVADLLRKEWMRSLARRERWAEVRQQAGKWQMNDDVAVNCLVKTIGVLLGDHA